MKRERQRERERERESRVYGVGECLRGLRAWKKPYADHLLEFIGH